MDHQQFILDNLTRILNATDKSKADDLLKVGASCRQHLYWRCRSFFISFTLLCDAFGACWLQRLYDW